LSLKWFVEVEEEVCRERPEEDQIASSYLRCGSLKEGTLRGMEKADMVVDEWG
jgi:hypothetical protein